MRKTIAKKFFICNSPSRICLPLFLAIAILIPISKKYDNELSWKIEYYYHEHLKSHVGQFKPKRDEMVSGCPYCGKPVVQIYEEAVKDEK